SGERADDLGDAPAGPGGERAAADARGRHPLRGRVQGRARRRRGGQVHGRGGGRGEVALRQRGPGDGDEAAGLVGGDPHHGLPLGGGDDRGGGQGLLQGGERLGVGPGG